MPRPRFKQTAEQRRLVKSLSAFGVPQEQIAGRIGIRSLRNHFREELDRGILEANTNVAHTLYKMATSGKDPITTLFWLKSRAGWKERPTFESRPLPPPPFVVAQEEGVQP